ncbi:MAG: hypothetical protein AB7K24_04420 [Gemmataceae bacterium]
MAQDPKLSGRVIFAILGGAVVFAGMRAGNDAGPATRTLHFIMLGIAGMGFLYFDLKERFRSKPQESEEQDLPPAETKSRPGKPLAAAILLLFAALVSAIAIWLTQPR